MYAISPIYLSALIVKRGSIVEAGPAAQKVTVGIVWVKVLLSSLSRGRDAGAAAARELKANDQEREFILIRKKRAVLPDVFRIRPLLEKTAVLSLPAVSPVLTSGVHKVPCRRCFRQENMSIFIHAGLSPPLRSS
jgi:hypothetical protein